MLSFFLYLKERFPVPFVLLFALGYAAFTLGLSSDKNIWLKNKQGSLVNLLLLSSVFFFFLLRQRAIDEFRDEDHDKKYFPDRPVPRGLISKKQVLLLGLFAFAIEFISAYIVGHYVFGFYIIFLLYSLLMAKEFFIPKWLNKHFTTNFLIHEIIFLLFGLFFVSAVNLQLINLNLHTIVILMILTTAPMSVEVIRKFKSRYDKSGKVVADTYGEVWGRNNALNLLIILSLTIGIGLTYLKHSYFFLLLNFALIGAWLIIGKKSNSAVVIIGAVNFLIFALMANILW